MLSTRLKKTISDLAGRIKVKNRGRVNIVTTSKLENLLAMTADIMVLLIRRRAMMNC